MVFLNPSILLGLLGASIPILIHLINFRKLKKVEFSTLAFLKELQKSKIKKIKIKQWLLLLLRVLIIVFLVLAFARPTLENVNFSGSTSTARASSVFIIDNSFSMNYIGEDGSYINKSKKLAKDVITLMKDGDELSFLISKDSISTTTNIESAIKIIDNLNTNLISETIQDKLESSLTFLEKSQNINKEIFLFSDFQQSTFANVKFSDSVLLNSTDGDIKLYSFDMAISKASNYSINNLKLNSSIIELNKPVTFSAKIHNHSEDKTNNITASLFINDKRVAQQNVTLNKRENKTIELETSLSSSGLIEARVELEEDNIADDNAYFLTFWIPEKIKVLVLYKNTNDLLFLEAALNSSTTNGQIQVTKMRLSNSLNENLQKFNVVFLVSDEITNLEVLTDYLKQGGNLIFIPPSNINVNKLSNIKRLLSLPEFDDIVSTSSNTNYAEFGDINFDHPIFISLFENNNKREVESPAIFKYIKFKESVKTQSIINLIDGSVFLGEYNYGKGKILFMNSSPSFEWNNLPIKGIFAPLITRMVLYLSSKQDQNKTFLVGDRLIINTSQLTFPLIDVELPNGNDNINLQNNDRQNLSYKNTFQPGSYKFYNKDDLIHFTAINPDPKESNLIKVENGILLDYYNALFPNNYLVFESHNNFIDEIKKARFGTELWKYLLIIALLLALIEMFIARSTKKDLVSLN